MNIFAALENFTQRKRNITCIKPCSCYLVKQLEILNDKLSNIFNNDLTIKPIVIGDEIFWVHTNSMRPTISSTAIGKAIEARGHVEMIGRSEEAA